LSEELDEFRPPGPPPGQQQGFLRIEARFAPTFYVREIGGYLPAWEFGLITEESRANPEAELDRQFGHHDSSMIPLTRLPKAVFNRYYGIDLRQPKKEKLREDLERAGWKVREDDEDIWRFRLPVELCHKYVTVTHGDLARTEF